MIINKVDFTLRSNFCPKSSKENEYTNNMFKKISKSNKFISRIIKKISLFYFIVSYLFVIIMIFLKYFLLAAIIFSLISLLLLISLLIIFVSNISVIAILINFYIFLCFQVIELCSFQLKTAFSIVIILLYFTFRMIILKIYYPSYRINIITNAIIIYYDCMCFEKFYNPFYNVIKNEIIMFTYYSLKIMFHFLVSGYSYFVEKNFKRKFNKCRDYLLENSYYLEILEKSNSGLIIFDEDNEIIYQNEKYLGFVEQFLDQAENINLNNTSKTFLEVLLSKSKLENLDKENFSNLMDYLKNSFGEEYLSSEGTLSFFYLCDFLRKNKEYYHNFNRMLTVILDETNQFTTHEIFVRVGTNQIEFVINEKTNFIKFRNVKLQNEIKGLLIAKIAHDFKSPLIAIDRICNTLKQINQISESSSNNSSDDNMLILRSHDSLNSRIDRTTLKEKADLLQNLSRYLLNLVEDINLVVNERANDNIEDTESLKICDLKDVCKFCLKIFKIKKNQDENKNIDIKFYYDKTLPEKIKINEKIIKQILINLLSNSYKFTSLGFIKLSVYNKDGNILFEVEDTGIGIKKEFQSHLFQPFYMIPSKLNPNGSGLGLYIVTDLIKKFGSELKFTSEYGKGSTFSFSVKNFENLMRSQSSSSTLKMLIKPQVTLSQKELFEKIRDDTAPCKSFDSKLMSDSERWNSDESYKMNEMSDNSFLYKIRKNSRKYVWSDESMVVKGNNEPYTVKVSKVSSRLITSKNNLNTILIPTSKKSGFNNCDKIIRGKEKETLNYVIKIMICDDDREVRSAIKNLLLSILPLDKEFSLSIQETFNGIECLYQLYKDFKNGICYDLLLIDENMPYLKGSTVVQSLVEMKSEISQMRKIKLISVTGDNYPETIKYLKSKGVDEVLIKPVNRLGLEKLINGILDTFCN